MTNAWTVETWRNLATMKNKVADASDFQDGRAVFYQEGRPVEPIDMPLPIPAVLTMDDTDIAVVIVQAERTIKPSGVFETFGALNPNGEQFVFTPGECRVVDSDDPSWLILAGQSR